MKKMIFGVLAAGALLASCEKSDDGGYRINEPSVAVQETMYAMYPEARNITWESRGGYVVADFDMPTDYKAWFDVTGLWYMTEQDMRFTELPEAVQQAFRSGEYAAMEMDDVDCLVRDAMETLYVIEVEGRNSAGREVDYDLYYSADGVLVKVVEDAEAGYDYADFIPQTLVSVVQSWIENRYPGARVLEIDGERGTTEVEILDGKVRRDLYFAPSGEWLRTATELHANELPEMVKQRLATDYAAYHIDEVKHIEEPTVSYYLVELEQNDRDSYVKIAADGTVL